MSPGEVTALLEIKSGPRASGDEPVIIEVNQETVKWSPRERG